MNEWIQALRLISDDNEIHTAMQKSKSYTWSRDCRFFAALSVSPIRTGDADSWPICNNHKQWQYCVGDNGSLWTCFFHWSAFRVRNKLTFINISGVLRLENFSRGRIPVPSLPTSLLAARGHNRDIGTTTFTIFVPIFSPETKLERARLLYAVSCCTFTDFRGNL